MAPASVANADWVELPVARAATSSTSTRPAARAVTRPARASASYAGGNFPGTTGTHPYAGTPATRRGRLLPGHPDTVVECPDEDVEPPATTRHARPGAPGAGGTYNGPVRVQPLGDRRRPASGVDHEYSVDGGEWQTADNQDGADPFTASVKVGREGAHTMRYRARDAEGNLAAPQEVAFAIADLRDVFAEGDTWSPDALTVPFGSAVTWHFDEPAAGHPHDVWLVAPDTDPQTGIVQVTNGPVFPGGPPVSFTFRKSGAWMFVCRLHSSFDTASGTWAGMTGTVDVGDDPGPGRIPVPARSPAVRRRRCRTRRSRIPARCRRRRPRPSSAACPGPACARS